MKNFHDDMYLWRTINETVGDLEDAILEEIYKRLYNTAWSIKKIEDLAEKLSNDYWD